MPESVITMEIPMENGRKRIKSDRMIITNPQVKIHPPPGMSKFDKSRLNPIIIIPRTSNHAPMIRGIIIIVMAGLALNKMPNKIVIVAPIMFQARVKNQLRELSAITTSVAPVIIIITPKTSASNR